jgi:tryptophan-rich sensory protein
MAIRIETRQPSALIVVLSIIVVVIAIIAHLTPIRAAPWLTQYHFWIAVAGYGLLLWRTLF